MKAVRGTLFSYKIDPPLEPDVFFLSLAGRQVSGDRKGSGGGCRFRKPHPVLQSGNILCTQEPGTKFLAETDWGGSRVGILAERDRERRIFRAGYFLVALSRIFPAFLSIAFDTSL